MKDTIIYRPYRSYVWTLPFTISLDILVFMIAGFFLPYWGLGVIVPVAMAIACAWANKFLYDSWRIAISFEPNGLRMIGGSYKDYRHVLWEELSYAYYVRSVKGVLFAVLSPKALSSKEAKKLANRGANSNRICIDDAVVICIENPKDRSQIKEIIENHVPHIVGRNNSDL